MRRKIARLLFRIARWFDPSIGEVVEFYSVADFDRRVRKLHDLDRFAREVAKRFAQHGPRAWEDPT